MLHGQVKPDDLEGALFCFGCTRDHALSLGAAGEYDELGGIAGDDPAEGEAVHAALMEVVATAEAGGRVSWHQEGGESACSRLNELLSQFDLPPLQFLRSGMLSLPEVHRLAREQGLPYHIISMASLG